MCAFTRAFNCTVLVESAGRASYHWQGPQLLEHVHAVMAQRQADGVVPLLELCGQAGFVQKLSHPVSNMKHTLLA